ncbi:MAG: acetylglutamate kinase [Clostridiales bacterium]|jgi:hypothetical protein|nr:acetylglutamate kinase [Clostridiales bacterium]
MKSSELDLILEVNNLWEQHAFWTKIAITSIVMGLPYEESVVNRLLRNPLDFARIFSVYYNRKTAMEFERLLTEHLLFAAKMIKEYIAGNIQDAKKAEMDWYKNADEIAKFLSHINPYWTKKDWQKAFYIHLEQVEELVDSLINESYNAVILITDELESHALDMAEMMWQGIIKQFHQTSQLVRS